MSTTARNNVIAGCVHQEGFLYHGHVPVLHSAAPIKQGDLVYWDATNHRATALDTDANAATLLGVALGSSQFNSNLDNSSSVSEPDINVGYGAIVNLKTTAGDTYNDGDALYVGADAQTVTNTAGMATHKVGIVRLPPKGAAVAGGAGVTIPVLVYSQAWVAFKA